MQSKTLKTEKPYWFLSTSPLCLLKGCSFFLYILCSGISQFSSDLTCSKPLISVSSLFCFYTNRFPHKVLPAIWTDYSFDYSSHSLVPLSSQKWVTIITLIVRWVGEERDIKLPETGAGITAPACQQQYSDTALPHPRTSLIIAVAKAMHEP